MLCYWEDFVQECPRPSEEEDRAYLKRFWFWLEGKGVSSPDKADVLISDALNILKEKEISSRNAELSRRVKEARDITVRLIKAAKRGGLAEAAEQGFALDLMAYWEVEEDIEEGRLLVKKKEAQEVDKLKERVSKLEGLLNKPLVLANLRPSPDPKRKLCEECAECICHPKDCYGFSEQGGIAGFSPSAKYQCQEKIEAVKRKPVVVPVIRTVCTRLGGSLVGDVEPCDSACDECICNNCQFKSECPDCRHIDFSDACCADLGSACDG